MRRRVLILFVWSSVVALALLAALLYPRLQDRIRYAHTRFLLTQIHDVLAPGPIPRTESDLISVLDRSSIDWNSCRLDGDRVLDGWGQRINATLRADGSVLTLTSAGIDGRFDTADDVQATIHGRTNGEPNAGPNSR